MSNNLEVASVFMYEYAEDEVGTINKCKEPEKIIRLLQTYKNESLGYLKGCGFEHTNDLVNNAIEDLTNNNN